MAARKRIVKKLPAFKLPRTQDEAQNEDLKKVKEQVLKELEENEAKEKEWYDNELEKNLKKQ